MVHYRFSEREAGLIYAAGLTRHLRAVGNRLPSDNESVQTLDSDILGASGELAVLRYTELPLDDWNSLWNYKLPDVGPYEVKTSRTGSALYVQKNKLDRCKPSQVFVLAQSRAPLVATNLIGWTTAGDISELAEYTPTEQLYRLPAHELAPIDELKYST